MDKKSQTRLFVSLIIGVILLSIVYLTFISAPDLGGGKQVNSASVTVTSQPYWKLIKYTGTERDTFTKPIIDTHIQAICFKPIDSKYNSDVTVSLNEATSTPKDTVVLTKDVNGNYCYDYSRTAINEGDYLKIGTNTIIQVYESDKIINYDFDWGQTNLTLRKKVDNEYVNIGNISVYWNTDKWKASGNDTSLAEGELANFSYTLNSTDLLIVKPSTGYSNYLTNGTLYNCSETNESDCTEYNGTVIEYYSYNYPLVYNFKYTGSKTEDREYYNFNDVCSKTYSNCNWVISSDRKSMTVYFTSDKNIDPDIVEQPIIKITDAEELYSNRSFKENIFPYVELPDGLYYTIPANNYLRTYWETNLTNHRTIDVYAKADSGTATLEVYKKDDNNLIYSINISSNDKYTINLSNMINYSDSFDFKVLNNPIEFDYIIDPDTESSETDNLSEWRMYGRYLNHSSWDSATYPTIAGLNNVNYPYLNASGQPAIANGYVYVLSSINGMLYQLNATNISQEIAKYTGTVYLSGNAASPIVSNGYVYVNFPNTGELLQLNASNISQKINNYSIGVCEGSPVLYQDSVYIAGALYLFRLNATNISQQLDNYSVGFKGGNTPAIANGYIYFSQLGTLGNPRLLQLNATNLSQVITKVNYGAALKGSPVVYNGYVYFLRANILMQLNASNVSLQINNFSLSAGSPVTTPVIVNNYVYIGDANNQTFQLNASNVSKQIANFTLAGTGTLNSPVYANGYIYMTSASPTNNGIFYQLNASNISKEINNFTTEIPLAAFGLSFGIAYANGYIYSSSSGRGNFYQLNATNISLENNFPVSDTVYPQFTNSATSPANNTEYAPNKLWHFNITILNSNGTAGIEFNGTNYTMSNSSATLFNKTLSSLATGVYAYYYWAYGNGTSALFNNSETYSYTIAQNSSYNMTITGTTPIIYPSPADISNSSCPNQLICKLYRNDTGEITSPDNTVLGVGFYNYTFNSTNTVNYSAKTVSFLLEVQQNTSAVVYTYLNHTRDNITIYNNTNIYLNGTLFNVTGTISLYKNGTLINSGTSKVYNITDFNGTGLYNITTIYEGNTNYSRAFETWFVNVTTPLVADIVYPQFSNNQTYPVSNSEYAPNKVYHFNITIVNSNGTAGIEFNGTNYTMTNSSNVFNKSFSDLGVGVYDYYYWAYGNGTEHLFNNSETYSYKIIQNSSYNMSVIGVTPITYPAPAGISNTSCPNQIECKLYRNDTGEITSPDNTVLGVGFYKYIFNSSGNYNYTSQSNSNFVLEVQKNTTGLIIYTYLNHSRANITIYNNTEIWLNTTSNIPRTLKLFKNGTLINSGTSPLGNLTSFNATGIYNITGLFEGDTNYSSANETWWVNVTSIVDTTPPYFITIPSDISQSYPNNFGVSFNATDEIGFGYYSINWTNTFEINQSGYLNNTVKLGVGEYYINVTINDTSGNTNSTVFNINITQNNTYVLALTITPATTVTYPTETTATGSNCPTELICNLTLNTTGEVVNPHVETLGVGVYNYTFNTSGNANYSANSISEILTVNQNTSLSVYTYLNHTRDNITIYNNTNIYLNGTLNGISGIIKLYKNGTLINSGNSPLSNLTDFNGTGVYNITTIYEGNTNYSFANETWWVNVTTVIDTTAPYFVTIPANATIIYPANWSGVSFNATDTTEFGYYAVNDSRFTINQSGFLDDLEILGVGVYLINVSINDTSGNYNYTIYKLTVNQNTTCGLNITFIPSNSETYPTETNVTGTGCISGLSCNLSRNDTGIVSNSDVQTLGVGVYNYTYNRTGNTNYSACQISGILTINQNTSATIYTYLNHTRDNITIYNNTAIWLNTTLNIVGNLKLYKNGTLINTGASPLGNLTDFNTTGIYNITGLFEGNSNYSSKFETWWVNVTSIIDIIPPSFIDGTPVNQTKVYGTALSYDINATDNVAMSCFAVNDSRFKIDCNGLLENATSLGGGLYWINITINDTNNNLNSTVMWVNVTKATPVLIFLANGGTSNLTLTYPTQVNISATASTGTVGLDRDDVDVLSENSLNVTLGANSYIYRANITGNQNYSDVGYSYYNITITKASQTITPLLNGINANLTITYPQQFNASFTGTNQTAVTITTNNTVLNKDQNYSWGAGSWTVNFSMPSNQNYSGFETYMNLTINKKIGTLTFLLNGIASDLIITYPTQVNASAYSSSGQTIVLSRNSVDVTTENNVNVTLGANGTAYLYYATAQANENYSDLVIGRYLNVTKANSLVYTYLNHTRDNITIVQGNSIWLNGTLITGNGNIRLYNDSVLINNGTSPISNLTNFSTAGAFNVTVIYLGNDNYSQSFETWWVKVSGLDTTPPTFTNCRNFTHQMNTSFSQSITATDDFGISDYFLNQTTNFTVNSSNGLITNSSSLDIIKIYWLNLTVNDTSNNKASCIFYVNVTPDITTPSITIISPISTVYTISSILFNVTLNELGYCEYSLNSGITNITMNTTDNLTFFNTSSLADGSYTVNFYCNDTSNNKNSSNISFTINTFVPPGGGGGGGGNFSFQSNPTICNITYLFILNDSNDTNLINYLVYDQTGSYSSEGILRIYLDNWQLICSDLINRTAMPRFVCQKIYYSVLNNRNLNQTKTDIETKVNISNSLLIHYINNYNELCYKLGYSDKIDTPIRIIELNQTRITCTQPEGMYLPFLPISFGNVDCLKVKDWNWLFLFDTSNGNLKVIGIQVWIVLAILCLLVVLIIFVVLRTNGKVKRFLKENTNLV